MRGTPLTILAQGQGWLVVAKPPRLVVHRNEHMPRARAALQRVRDMVGCAVYPIHRLDAAASGCLLFATDQALAGPLSAAMTTGVKTYVALVRGACGEPRHVVVDRPLRDDNGIDKASRTELTCIAGATEPRCSLVVARPQTGRFHQVRRHLRGISHPIIGDVGHGDRHTNRWWRENGGIDRLALHCLSLSLTLPDGQPLNVSCPLLSDLAAAFEVLPFWADVLAEVPALGAPPIALEYDFQRREPKMKQAPKQEPKPKP